MRRVANQKPLAREDACTVSMRVLMKIQVIYDISKIKEFN